MPMSTNLLKKLEEEDFWRRVMKGSDVPLTHLNLDMLTGMSIRVHDLTQPCIL
jgi:hypothetical protein